MLQREPLLRDDEHLSVTRLLHFFPGSSTSEQAGVHEILLGSAWPELLAPCPPDDKRCAYMPSKYRLHVSKSKWALLISWPVRDTEYHNA